MQGTTYIHYYYNYLMILPYAQVENTGYYASRVPDTQIGKQYNQQEPRTS